MSSSAAQRAFQNARLKKKHKAEVAKLLEHAISLHQKGLLPDARAVCRQLLLLAPDHFDALYFLGVSEYHARNFPEAETLLTRAVEVRPDSAEAHYHRGVVFYALQRYDDARASYLQAIVLKPTYQTALYNLAHVCGALDRPEEALENYDRVIALNKDYAEAHYNRGLILTRLRRFREAVESHDRALAVKPRFAEALNGRGVALEKLEDLTGAIESFDKAIAINSHRADAFSNRGSTLRALQRRLDALDSYDKAIAINPDLAEAQNGRGAVLYDQRAYQQADISFSRALAVQPDYPDALLNRGLTRLELIRFDEAQADFDRAIALQPGMSEAELGRGLVFLYTKKVAEVIDVCETILAIEPESFGAHLLRARCFAELGDIDAAITRYDRALSIRPGDPNAIASRIFYSDYLANADFKLHRDVRRAWWEHIGSKIADPLRGHYPNVRDPERRLVLGYVSADFRNHSAAHNFGPILAGHDKSAFEIVCYSCSLAEDEVTEKFRQVADRWHSAAQWSNEQLTDQIRHDQIDILIDLSGHTNGNRLEVFARKPAPIQIHGFGHGSPPGLPTIDYVFSDPVSIPPEVRHLFEEKIYDLPSIISLEPVSAEIPRAELPALAAGFVTFGVFNRINKISDEAVDVWSRILNRLKDSRLLIKDHALDDMLVRSKLLERFARYGISAERIDLLGSTSRTEHLTAFNRVDICLDPFPQNGGVSTWEALHMGVPVIAKLGTALPNRAAAAIVTAVGLPDWVAKSADDYVNIGVTRGSDINGLAELRRALPQQIAASEAGNPVSYEKAVATAYRTMWRTYCENAKN